MKDEKNIITTDLYLAAFMSLNGFNPEYEISGNRVAFAFPANEGVTDIMREFHGNTRTPVWDYVQKIRTIKGEMLSRKNGR